MESDGDTVCQTTFAIIFIKTDSLMTDEEFRKFHLILGILFACVLSHFDAASKRTENI